MRNSVKQLGALLAGVIVGGLALVNGAQAATCTAGSAITNPDATLTNSGPCGVGVLGDENPNEAEILTVTGEAWTMQGSAGSPLFLTFNGTTGGQWFIDASAPDDTDWLVVIKNGAAGTPPNDIKWVWFDIDTSIACADTAYDYCGDWTMYGEGGKIKNISNMSLFSQEGDDRLVPEPATLLLIGAALVGAVWSRRKLA